MFTTGPTSLDLLGLATAGQAMITTQGSGSFRIWDGFLGLFGG